MLRELTCPIKINQIKVPGRKKPVWIAGFGPNMVPLLTRTAREHDHPDSLTWEYLSQRGWTMTSEAEVALDAVPIYSQHAKAVARLVEEQRMSCREASQALGINPQVARQAYQFARHGLKAGQPDPNRGKQEGAFMYTQGAEPAQCDISQAISK